MLFSLAVWIEGVIIVFPAIVDALSWFATPSFYRTHQVSAVQKGSYLAGLTAVSLSTVAYLGYFAWRVCSLYQLSLPLRPLILLDHFLYPAALLSSVAIVTFFVGRGPNRLVLTIAATWVALQIWIHHGIIHWA